MAGRRVLNKRDAAGLLNDGQAVCAVGHMTRQDDADCACAELLRCGSKERIDGWTEAVLAWDA